MKVYIVTEQWCDGHSSKDPEILKVFDNNEKADRFTVDFIKKKWRNYITEFLFPECSATSFVYNIGEYYYRIEEFEVE